MIKQELEVISKKVVSYLTKSTGVGIVLLDSNLNILDCNLGFLRLFNPLHNPTGRHINDFLELNVSDIRCEEQLKISCSHNTGMVAANDCYIIKTDDGYLLFCERMLLSESRALVQIGSMNDELINLQRESVKKNHQMEKLRRQLDERVAELEASLQRVKQLEGIIPV